MADEVRQDIPRQLQILLLSTIDYRISRNFCESKIKRFNLKIEKQILARRNLSDF